MADLTSINSESFFSEEKISNKVVEPPKEAQVALAPSKEMDESVCEVKFCTGGRLSAPPILHFHDYNMRASQAIADLPNAEDHTPLIIKILNSMVVEDFNCGLLHIEEAKEVLLNVHGKWWGGVLSGFRYLLDENIKDREKLFDKSNISTADIPLNNIKVKPLDPKIKEPINITCEGHSVHFIYPRLQNPVITKEMSKNKFAVQEQELADIANRVNWNDTHDDSRQKKVSPEEYTKYNDFLAEKAEYELLVTRAQMMCGVDGKVLNSLDERVKELKENPHITVRHWALFNEFLDKDGSFGVQDDVTFFSDLLGQEITRRFPFRTYSFIPYISVATDGAASAEISFG